MIRKVLFLLIHSFLSLSLPAQQPVFTHYSQENGLSENTVMSILQDRKGMMWFSTWDGLDKFDGYTFTTYKATFRNGINLTTNRIDKIQEDPSGFLWLTTNDHQAFRFNPATENFEHVSTGKGIGNVVITEIELKADSTVWLMTENQGVIRVSTDPATRMLRKKWYVHQPDAKVYDIYVDREGNEWILSSRGLFRISGKDILPSGYVEKPSRNALSGYSFYAAGETTSFVYFGTDNGLVWCYDKMKKRFVRWQLPVHSAVIAIRQVGPDRMAFFTRTAGFCLFSTRSRKLEVISSDRYPAGDVKNVYVDRNNSIWINQNIAGTVVYYNTRQSKLKVEKVSIGPVGANMLFPVFHIHEDINGRIWVHPFGGGFSYLDPADDCLRPFYSNDFNRTFSNKIHTAFSDRQGNLWLATRSKGIEKVTFHKSQFSLIAPDPVESESLANNVRALGEDKDGHIFVGAKDGLVRVYDQHYNYLGYLTESGTVAPVGSPLKGNVYFIMRDRHNTLWLATKGLGIVKAEPVGHLRYRLTQYVHDSRNRYSLSNDNVYCVYEDKWGRIWIATYGGGLNYMAKDADGKDIFINPNNRLNSFPQQECGKVRFVTGDQQNNIWIGTTQGVLRMDGRFRTPEQIRFWHYMREPGNPSSLSNNDVHRILLSSRNRLYFVTYGGGLNKLEKLTSDGGASFRSYTMENGLSADILLSACEDRAGHLWISSENGVSQFDALQERFENYTSQWLNLQIRFNEATSLYTPSGQVLFGTDKGVLAFNPVQVHKSTYSPSIVLSKLLISNVEEIPGKGGILQNNLDNTAVLELPHDKNIFTIQYAALDYTNPSEIQYAYRLKGFDKDWNYVGRQRTATYTNLPKGDYVFEVRSTNADGVWSRNVRTIEIKMLPSFWETGWAYLLYFLLILLVMGTILYIMFTIYRLKHRVQMEKQLTDMKLRFFTDISHELRTPLVLISGPVEYILKEKPLSADLRKQLQVVERNTNRMLRLINQILDFRKIQNKRMKMRVERFDVAEFTKEILESFYSSAEEHQIRLSFDVPSIPVYVWADRDKFEKIVLNLVSNAFKYTPNGKAIEVTVGEDDSHVSISVRDEGIGIEKNRQKSIFDRFENVSDKDLFNNSSTGIGLSLAKKLADMHKAVISVDSQPGKGSCFRVDFQKGKTHFDNSAEFLVDDHTTETSRDWRADDTSRNGGVTVSEGSDRGIPDQERPSMLLVEDNTELRAFLHSIFETDYTLLEASDGEAGLKMALAKEPDIIISDIMMPVMDGIEMVKELRRNITVSHIPVILLTARTSIESRIQGLEYGADDYITKPFSIAYLSARVKNMLVRKRQQQEQFRKKLLDRSAQNSVTPVKTPKEPDVEMTDADRRFMDKFVALVQKNLDNGDLEIGTFACELAVSRSVFFKKIKTLTGVAPVEFVREMRIARAIELIKTGEYSMTQVAYMVGFNDPHYFSKTFKLKTGKTPTEYMKSGKD